jgi:hypothetical protein
MREHRMQNRPNRLPSSEIHACLFEPLQIVLPRPAVGRIALEYAGGLLQHQCEGTPGAAVSCGAREDHASL